MKTTYFLAENNAYTMVIVSNGEEFFTGENLMDNAYGVELCTSQDSIDSTVKKLKAALTSEDYLYSFEECKQEYPDSIYPLALDDFERIEYQGEILRAIPLVVVEDSKGIPC